MLSITIVFFRDKYKRTFHSLFYACMHAKSLQSCPTFWEPMNYSLPPSPHPAQALLSMGFFRQYWCGLPCPPPGDLPHPGIKPVSPAALALQVDSLPLSHVEAPIICLLNYKFTKIRKWKMRMQYLSSLLWHAYNIMGSLKFSNSQNLYLLLLLGFPFL